MHGSKDCQAGYVETVQMVPVNDWGSSIDRRLIEQLVLKLTDSPRGRSCPQHSSHTSQSSNSLCVTRQDYIVFKFEHGRFVYNSLGGEMGQVEMCEVCSQLVLQAEQRTENSHE